MYLLFKLWKNDLDGVAGGYWLLIDERNSSGFVSEVNEVLPTKVVDFDGTGGCGT